MPLVHHLWLLWLPVHVKAMPRDALTVFTREAYEKETFRNNALAKHLATLDATHANGYFPYSIRMVKPIQKGEEILVVPMVGISTSARDSISERYSLKRVQLRRELSDRLSARWRDGLEVVLAPYVKFKCIETQRRVTRKNMFQSSSASLQWLRVRYHLSQT